MSDQAQYNQLLSATRDLLSELRVGPENLEVMAKGYSPDYPGAPTSDPGKPSQCKVQLSKVVAGKLIAAGVNPEKVSQS